MSGFRKTAFAVAAPFLMALAGCLSQDPEPLAKIGKEQVILAFGDSLTSGVGGNGQSYPGFLEDIVGFRVVSSAVPGEMSTQALARFPAVMEAVKPALVILCTGGNDILRKTGDETMERNIREMIRLAKGKGVGVVLLGIPKFSVFRSNHPVYERIASAETLWLEDEVLKRVLHDDSLKSDLVHPNAKGYRVMAEAVAALLREAGAI